MAMAITSLLKDWGLSFLDLTVTRASGAIRGRGLLFRLLSRGSSAKQRTSSWQPSTKIFRCKVIISHTHHSTYLFYYFVAQHSG